MFNLTDAQLHKAATRAATRAFLRECRHQPGPPPALVLAAVRALGVLDARSGTPTDEDDESVVVEGQAAS